MSDTFFKMVGHQNVGVQPKAIALAVVLEALEIALAVLVVLERSLSLVAAHNDVVERTVKLDSGFSRHARRLSVGVCERK